MSVPTSWLINDLEELPDAVACGVRSLGYSNQNSGYSGSLDVPITSETIVPNSLVSGDEVILIVKKKKEPPVPDGLERSVGP